MPYRKRNFRRKNAKRGMYRTGSVYARAVGPAGPARPGAGGYRQRQGQLASRAGAGSVLSPFPPVMWTVFSYSETFTLAQGTIGVPAVRLYRANSLFDPSKTGVGLKSRYTDSLLGADNGTAPYSRYRVHASSVSATVWPVASGSNQANCLISLIPKRPIVGDPSTVDEQRERPYARHLAMTTTASYKPRKVKNFCKIKTHLGHKDLMDVDSTAAAYNANPVEEVDWAVCLTDVQGSNTASATIQLTIRYFVQLYTLNDVADS